MVQKTADVFDGFPRISPKFGGCVPKDMHSRRRDASLFEISLQVAIECSAGDAFTSAIVMAIMTPPVAL